MRFRPEGVTALGVAGLVVLAGACGSETSDDRTAPSPPIVSAVTIPQPTAEHPASTTAASTTAAAAVRSDATVKAAASATATTTTVATTTTAVAGGSPGDAIVETIDVTDSVTILVVDGEG